MEICMKTKVELLGTSFVLHSDQDSDYIEKLLSYIKEQLIIIKQDVECNDSLKASIMASLLISHELFSLRDSVQKEHMETSNIVKKLSIALEQAIDT